MISQGSWIICPIDSVTSDWILFIQDQHEKNFSRDPHTWICCRHITFSQNSPCKLKMLLYWTGTCRTWRSERICIRTRSNDMLLLSNHRRNQGSNTTQFKYWRFSWRHSQCCTHIVHNSHCSHEKWQKYLCTEWKNKAWERSLNPVKAPVSRPHSWSIKEWSGCGCSIVGFWKVRLHSDRFSLEKNLLIHLHEIQKYIQKNLYVVRLCTDIRVDDDVMCNATWPITHVPGASLCNRNVVFLLVTSSSSSWPKIKQLLVW